MDYMVIKLEFFNLKKNNLEWWNKLFDRIPPFEKRTWEVVTGGCKFGDQYASFKIIDKETKVSPKKQDQYNEIIEIFFLDLLNIEKFYIDGVDVSKAIKNR
jgi:hypothetical protein